MAPWLAVYAEVGLLIWLLGPPEKPARAAAKLAMVWPLALCSERVRRWATR